MQDALRRLSDYWTNKGCLTWQPFNTEVGAGTMNPATVLRVLGPEPWDVAYVEPSVRPDDSRYGENPNRLQTHTQFQVILKPEPGDPQELYLGSLEALGIDLSKHDVRFVEDNWQQPAIGAWGLGWEVWLDGMEITQFTYFQQVGGQNLDPIPVELTYGVERILMAQQGVTHFKDIVYSIASDGRPVTYGEALGQQEYEMSRYYLDDADVEANRRLYETYVGEATRMVEKRLPVPAHNYILKSSHAFNVLDARGAISTTERAKAFATMRRLMRDTAALWIERREELGFPLNRETLFLEPDPRREAPGSVSKGPAADRNLAPQTLAFEIGVEELPPHVVPQTIDAVRAALTEKLAATRLAHGEITVEGTPRRIVATIADLAASEPDTEQLRKGPKWAAAFDGDGNPTKALQGFMRGQDAAVEQIEKADFGGNEHAVVRVAVKGRDVLDVMGVILADVVSGLRAEKNMRWNDPKLSFSRAIRWIVALWGDIVVPVQVSELTAGRTTYLQRPVAGEESGRRSDGALVGRVEVASADDLLPTIAAGSIELFTDARRAAIIEQATALASGVGGTIAFDAESAVVDEITNLVEDPHGVLGNFDERYLDLPERILTTVMRKHQRYLPVYRDGKLAPHFVTMANGLCDDDTVRAGNESVIRARYEDALFFWNADLQTAAADEFVPGLDKLTFEDRLGSVGLRARRIADVATRLGERVGVSGEDLVTLKRAGELAKFDLATQMVVEMSSLAGFIAREYAVRMGETHAVADALFEMEQPHTSADPVPASVPGALLALGDRFDLLAAMFALGAKPTGSSDPFGLRRAALGVVRILRESAGTPLESLTIRAGLEDAVARLAEQGVDVAPDAVDAALEFTVGRFAQLLRDEGTSADLVSAILPAADAPGRAARLLSELSATSDDSRLHNLVATLVRITRILPDDVVDSARSEEGASHRSLRRREERATSRNVLSEVDDNRSLRSDEGASRKVLTEAAELELAAAVDAVDPDTAAQPIKVILGSTEHVVAAAARFFDEILVNAEDESVRAARQSLLASVLSLAPADIDWKALDIALG
ncbi:MAG: glycine--tRNA ligase subunit beta [Tessaracoccus sp.]|uniref:glycine--tRNA ligase subunit beta n=1 Tax=Tessaracoccus sp. TaxID=1971211 RepID=UPI001EB1D467|nr:glycine--tRNA ligase subunit beta [Tessaracoccus sp.]MBK7821947.1 glycine--tRNA ligase subunit beta [Tessaracoccus sp.]